MDITRLKLFPMLGRIFAFTSIWLILWYFAAWVFASYTKHDSSQTLHYWLMSDKFYVLVAIYFIADLNFLKYRWNEKNFWLFQIMAATAGVLIYALLLYVLHFQI
jgi:hypothetical protein